MFDKFPINLAVLARHFFQGVSTAFGRFRFWLGMWIMPKDVSNFTALILSKMSDDVQKLDSEKRNKIQSLKIDFEFRD